MGSKAPPTTTSTTTQQLSPEQQKLLELAMPFITKYAGTELQPFGKSGVAGFDPNEVAAQEGALNQVGAIDDLARRSAESQKFMLSLDQLNPDTNPYLKGVADKVAGGITDQLTQSILPSIRGGAISAGGPFGGGSTRAQMAESLAGEKALGSIGDTLNNLYYTNYNNGLNNIARAQGMNDQVMDGLLFGTRVQSGVGGQRRALEQAKLDEEQQQHWLTQMLPFMQASDIVGLLGGIPGGSTTSTNTGATPQGSPFGSALGGAAAGASIGSTFMPGVGTGVGAILGGLGGFGSGRGWW